MAIFNELATDLMILNEKRSREDYHRESFKKKYKFEPSKEDKDIGTITDKQGKKYKVDMRKSKTVDMDLGSFSIPVPRSTSAIANSKDSEIILDKNFFKLKGSNKSERRDAILQHEIGHQNLHNINPENKTVDKKNRDIAVFKNFAKGTVKDQSGLDISKDGGSLFGATIDHGTRKDFYDGNGAKEYAASATKDKNEKKQRRADLAAAKKYEGKGPHQNASEFEADRFAANRTSEGAVKRALRDSYKNVYKDNSGNKEVRKYFTKSGTADMERRTKALKDKDLRNAKTYK